MDCGGSGAAGLTRPLRASFIVARVSAFAHGQSTLDKERTPVCRLSWIFGIGSKERSFEAIRVAGRFSIAPWARSVYLRACNLGLHHDLYLWWRDGSTSR